MEEETGTKKSAVSEWFEEIDAKRRVKAVCKPCWEIKYCPYGPLVEDFPLQDVVPEQRCRIFGHQCPVFSVAEPFTETRELRNISRTIPRPTQFRVLKRENQVCRKCNQPVSDEDIHFDHVIPWSKGGSSDEHNIQLLCSKCNRKKSASFEQEHLVTDVLDHVSKPTGLAILGFLMYLLEFAHQFRADEGRRPNAADVATRLNNGERGPLEEQVGATIDDMFEFFSGKRPEESKAKMFRALRDRWGFEDATIYTLRSIADYYDLDLNELMDAEIALINRLGWRVVLDAKSRKKWLAS